MEESRAEAAHQPEYIPRGTDTAESICCGAGREACQQSSQKARSSVPDWSCMVDGCSGTRHLYKLDAQLSPVQARSPVSYQAHISHTLEVPLEHDILLLVRYR